MGDMCKLVKYIRFPVNWYLFITTVQANKIFISKLMSIVRQEMGNKRTKTLAIAKLIVFFIHFLQ